MQPKDGNEDFLARRRLLGGMVSATGVSAAALLGLNAAAAAASTPTGQPEAPDELFALARLHNYRTRRSSSWDRTGATKTRFPWNLARQPLFWRPPERAW